MVAIMPKNICYIMFIPLLILSQLTSIVYSILIGTSVCNHLNINSGNHFLTRHSSLVNSPALRRYLAETEEIIVSILREHGRKMSGSSNSKTKLQECVTQAIARYLFHFEETTGKLKRGFKEGHQQVTYRAYNVAWNYIATHQLLIRFQYYLKPLYAALNSDTEDNYLHLKKQLDRLLWQTGWPPAEDVSRAGQDILMIQMFFDLDTVNISKGVIAGIETGLTMSAFECSLIAKEAISKGYYALAIEWFEQAAIKIALDGSLEKLIPMDRSFVESNLLRSLTLHDSELMKKTNQSLVFYTHKVSGQAPKVSRIRRRTIAKQNWRPGKSENNFTLVDYERICSIGNLKGEGEKSKLFCYYERKVNPFWTINPLKVEILSIRPKVILQYHQVIPNKLILNLLEEKTAEIFQSGLNSEDTKLLLTQQRVKSRNRFHTELFRILELMTGLNTKSPDDSEEIQVYGFAPGGAGQIFKLQSDAFQPNLEHVKQNGNRIATALLYFSDVIKGGNTILPQSKISVKPVPGSIVLWYNLKNSMAPSDPHFHGYCPVILGENWVAKIQIRSHAQMFLSPFKCAPNINNDDSVDVQFNGQTMAD